MTKKKAVGEGGEGNEGESVILARGGERGVEENRGKNKRSGWKDRYLRVMSGRKKGKRCSFFFPSRRKCARAPVHFGV